MAMPVASCLAGRRCGDADGLLGPVAAAVVLTALYGPAPMSGRADPARAAPRRPPRGLLARRPCCRAEGEKRRLPAVLPCRRVLLAGLADGGGSTPAGDQPRTLRGPGGHRAPARLARGAARSCSRPGCRGRRRLRRRVVLPAGAAGM